MSIRLGIIFDDRKTVKKVVISSTCFINEEFNFTDLNFGIVGVCRVKMK